MSIKFPRGTDKEWFVIFLHWIWKIILKQQNLEDNGNSELFFSYSVFLSIKDLLFYFLDCNDFSSASWIIESITDTSCGIVSLLKHSDWDSNWTDGVEQTPNRLRQNIIRLIGNCCLFCQHQAKGSCEIYRKQAIDGALHIPWAILTDHLTDCLAEVDVFNYYSLGRW